MIPESIDEVLRSWLTPGLTAAVALVILTISYRLGLAVVRRISRHMPIATVFVEAAHEPGFAVAALIAIQIVVQSSADELPWVGVVRHGMTLLLIAAVTWLAVRLISAISEAVSVLYPIGMADNLTARRMQTQARILTRTLGSIAVLVGISFALLTFPGVRNIGASLLASAGIIGLIVGIAAKPILGNLLAGLQIGMTQPIRLDDVVIVEGEWGRVEEIGRSYVVIAIWDQRRLVVPLQYFIEKPFENWTRVSSEITGTVFIWVDYSMPVDEVRAELQRICKGAREWDGRVCLVQVTEANDRAMQLRALVSSADASRNWDLRCHVREKLIGFVQRQNPGQLPRIRGEITTSGTKRDEPLADRKDGPPLSVEAVS